MSAPFLAAALAAGALTAAPAAGATPAVAATTAPRTVLVSVTAARQLRAGFSAYPALSADGRWLAFQSDAALVPGDGNGRSDVYLRDLATGHLTQVSRTGVEHAGGLPWGTSDRARVAVSGDGRLVAFASAFAQTPDATERPHTYVYDRATGRLRDVLADVPLPDPQAAQGTVVTGFSDDGRRALIESDLQNLAPGPVPTVRAARQTYLYDVATGRLARAVPRVSGVPLQQYRVRLTGDGRRLLVRADAALTEDGRGGGAFLRSVSSRSYLRLRADVSEVDGTGRYFAIFTARALVRRDTNRAYDVYRWDRLTGRLALVSITNAGAVCRPATGVGAFVPNGSSHPVISRDGRRIGFASNCRNLTGRADAGDLYNLFVRDLGGHTTRAQDVAPNGRLSTGSTGFEGHGYGFAMSGSGLRTAFGSADERLSGGRLPATDDAAVYIRGTGTIR